MTNSVGEWKKPIEMETGRLGVYRTITNTQRAAEMLLFEWPLDHGPALSAAQLKCLSALEGNTDPEVAKQAFMKAAEEADLFVRKH